MKKKYILIILFILIILVSSCRFSEGQVRKEIEKSAYCEAKKDCVDIGSYCPYGCSILVNKNEANRIQNLLEKSEDSCMYKCLPSSEDFDCINNKCNYSTR